MVRVIMTSRAHNGLFRKGTQVGYNLGVSCIRWDSNAERMVYQDSLSRLIWIRVQLVLAFCYQAFLLFKALARSLDPSVSPRDKISIRYVAYTYIMLNCNHVISVFNGRQFVQLLNSSRHLVLQQLGEGNMGAKLRMAMAAAPVLIKILTNFPIIELPKSRKI